ncbi:MULTISPECIES: alpha/beta fold hydrolase [unclassified Polaromonas]|uniref:alpha/beta fold hydrolase n=1 Tax=unclassified Polaromonas TaxID=2638319 RepID=UPI0018CBAA47|nr:MULTISPECIES: alpha/beta hydrolase [unclassified Polaromonas]MBG6072015.1 pimeloyl-ACP methyl ester carboxylesterase [Polaromonas sp. CG_9.7]MBG6114018.1 pimeloyl-ACP methyl ester carboxylesterase [Polaromonas sp. CG_9.2]MDH6184897.1 pimeloyl-ACP methyl ester carboxylesterase [Polaromonas sp. CG_23.6]
MNRFSSSKKSVALSPSIAVALATVVGAAATAAWVAARARQAERNNAPAGDIIDIDGVDLHYVERGEGLPVVLIHGNAVTHADFIASGLMDRLARTHRVIAFDRPGFGHSSRPRDRLWTPSAQADLLMAAFERLGIEQPVVVGHSMGTMVAMAMALDHPDNVRSLVLAGGYFYPGFRVDALLTAPVALPVVGDVMRYTVTAISARLMLKKMARSMFAPRHVPNNFFPTLSREMMLRPVQLRANAEDAAFMVPAADAMSKLYGNLTVPVTLIAGEEDVIVDPQSQSVRLHDELPQSELFLVPGVGHMVHYAALDRVANAIGAPQHAVPLDHFTSMTKDDLTLGKQPETSQS